jgi:flagellar biogenesis protein FliO
MNLKKAASLVCALTFLMSGAFAKTKVTDISLEGRNGVGHITIKLDGPMPATPELTVKDSMIQVAIPGSFVWPKIDKKVSLAGTLDTTLMAYQFDKDLVRFRAMLPQDMTGRENQVNVVLKDGGINVEFPLETTARKAQGRAPAIENDSENFKDAKATSYLDRVLAEKTQTNTDIDTKVVAKKLGFGAAKTQDVVKTAQASTVKEANSSFSLTSYFGKFIAFLGLVLLLFYGVVALMKKGVIKKGSLGFLNSTKTVEVLNTTFVAPKKNLILVRAHKQVFLLASSDKGMQFISEIRDTTGLLKDGEKDIAGDNFDTNLGDAGRGSKDFKLKEVIGESATDGEGGLAAFLDKKPVEDKVRLSDQIKTKIKGMKPLQ